MEMGRSREAQSWRREAAARVDRGSRGRWGGRRRVRREVGREGEAELGLGADEFVVGEAGENGDRGVAEVGDDFMGEVVEGGGGRARWRRRGGGGGGEGRSTEMRRGAHAARGLGERRRRPATWAV
ncbi:hypothetical protein Scep_017461 [Stephania cephalantha]|uniref:Uncharacterized protein n=1 Tax=Stephania cephalantha TaxID=152367 RepID=A0AAP0IPI9_9MAGN